MGQSKHKVVTDLDIQAYVDNELDEQEKRHITQVIRTDYDVAHQYEKLNRQKNLLQQWGRMKGY